MVYHCKFKTKEFDGLHNLGIVKSIDFRRKKLKIIK